MAILEEKVHDEDQCELLRSFESRHIHIWAIASGMHTMSAHLLIEYQSVSSSTEIVETVNRDLSQHFNISLPRSN